LGRIVFLTVTGSLNQQSEHSVKDSKLPYIYRDRMEV
jgi:hypothetical protein